MPTIEKPTGQGGRLRGATMSNMSAMKFSPSPQRDVRTHEPIKSLREFHVLPPTRYILSSAGGIICVSYSSIQTFVHLVKGMYIKMLTAYHA